MSAAKTGTVPTPDSGGSCCHAGAPPPSVPAAGRINTTAGHLTPQAAAALPHYPLRVNHGKPPIFSVTCADDKAAAWYDLGIHWLWGFHMEEALSCFEAAIEQQPAFCMAHWGIALAHGPNYNFYGAPYYDLSSQEELSDIFPSLKLARRHAEEALRLKDQCTPMEAALVDAIQTRYEEWQPGKSNQHLEKP